jgi:hypothetical protein
MRHFAFAAMAALAFLSSAAQAQTCGPLKRAISLDLSPAPGGGPRFTLPVSVNGAPKVFLLNTAVENSRIARGTVNEMGLKTATANNIRFLDSSGGSHNAYKVIVDLGIGQVSVKQNEMLIEENGGPVGGIFAPDLMQNFDIEMDFAGRKLNYFLTDHCDGKVVYWPNSGIASVAFRGWVQHGGALDPMTIPVSIDGHEVIARINTGTGPNVLDSDTARELLDLTPDSPGAVPLGALDSNPAHRIFGYTFKTLAIGGVTISNPRFTVRPDLIGKKAAEMISADSHVRRVTDHFLPTMEIGMDVLRRLHLYVAAKEQKLYLTLAADQAPGGTAPGTPGSSAAAAP